MKRSSRANCSSRARRALGFSGLLVLGACRGLVLTLGDVLFTTSMADLKSGATGNLNKLAAFLEEYPDRSVAIEGYTDSVGSEDYNQALSERPAESVKSNLTAHGIEATRLVASGNGRSDPVADHESAFGRQQNRRVEAVISNPPAALRFARSTRSRPCATHHP